VKYPQVTLDALTKLETSRFEAETDVQIHKIHNAMDTIRREAKTIIMASGYVFNKSGDATNKKIRADNLDLKIFTVGFVNMQPTHRNVKSYTASFITRTAVGSQYRQSLGPGNTLVTSLTPPVGISKSPKLKFTEREVIAALRGEYPSVSKCLDELFGYESTSSMAFDKNYALKVDEIGHITLYHQLRTVGVSYDDGETFSLMGKYTYLKEQLTKLGVKVND
jgi:hypothetical protein